MKPAKGSKGIQSGGGLVSVNKVVRCRYVLISVLVLSGPLAGTAGGQQVRQSGVGAFTIEAGGGTIGSLAGVLAGLAIARPDRCNVDDLKCTLAGLGAGGIGGTIGATVGSVVAGRAAGTRPSTPGAFVGAVAGAFAGAGFVHLLTEEVNLHLGKPVTLVVFSLAQGVLTAAGSRIGASLRR